MIILASDDKTTVTREQISWSTLDRFFSSRIPKITSPTNNTIWIMGSDVVVTWWAFVPSYSCGQSGWSFLGLSIIKGSPRYARKCPQPEKEIDARVLEGWELQRTSSWVFFVLQGLSNARIYIRFIYIHDWFLLMLSYPIMGIPALITEGFQIS